jgi:hypothetical protein
VDAAVRRQWTVWEPAPAPRAPQPGPLAAADGTPLHGILTAPHDASSDVVVAVNHGTVLACWRVPRRAWRAASPLLRCSNLLLPARAWLWSAGGRTLASVPGDTAVGLVLAGRKPAARASTPDGSRARRWADAAHDAGFVARLDRPADAAGPHTVTVARLERFGQLFDLDGLLADFAACGLERPTLDVAAAEAALLEAIRVADLLEDDRPASAEPPVPPGDDLDAWACDAAGCVRVGLTLGYHPALLAGALLGLSCAGAGLAGDVLPPARLHALAAVAHPATLPGLTAFGAAPAGDDPHRPRGAAQ